MSRFCVFLKRYKNAARTVGLAAAAAALLLPVLTGCGEEVPEEPKPADKPVAVLIADDEGLVLTGPNRLEVRRGETPSVAYSVRDGYTLERAVNAAAADGQAVLGQVYYPTTVILQTRKLRDCTIDVRVSGEEGCGTAAAEASVCREGDPVMLHAEAGMDFAFAGYTLGAPAAEGGELLAAEADYAFVPSDSTPVYANFERAFATVTLKPAPGLIVRTSDSVRAAVGARPFFSIAFEEGYVLKELGPGLTVENSTLYVDSLKEPCEVWLSTTALAKYDVQATPNIAGAGTVQIEPDKKTGWEGDTVRFAAECAPSYIFNGYSEGASLENGGRLLTKEAEFTAVLDRSLYLVANFELKRYRVSLAEVPGLIFVSGREQEVPAGSDAVFTVQLAENFIFDSVEGAEYQNGTLTLRNVSADTEITVNIHEDTEKHFEIRVNNEKWGSYSATKKSGYYNKGTSVTVVALPGRGGLECIRVNGKQVSTSASYSLSITEDTVLEIVFREPPDPALTLTVPSGKWAVLYHPNGGKFTSASGEYMTEYFSSAYYHCPNTLPSLNQFRREGYVLIGYNTKADGSGTFYGPGWNVVMPEGRRAISLYCVWVKETPASDFRYSVSSAEKTFQYSKDEKVTTKYVTISSYVGNAATVVIPEKIDGFPVTNLVAGAFISKSGLTTLVLPRTMFAVPALSVSSCPNLTTVYLYDSVQTMPDNWYSACPKLERLFLLAGRKPTYLSGRNGTYAIKYEWLITAPGKKLVAVSGSNTAYGLDSPLLEKKLAEAGFNFSVVNYGQNASSAAAFYIEVCSHHLNPGDILLVNPEFTNKYQFGYNEINSTLMQIFEGAYDAFSEVDIRHYVKLWSTIAAFDKTCCSRNPLSYEKYTTDTVNAWGDYSLNKKDATSSWKTTLDGYDANGGVSTVSYKNGANIITGNASYSENGRTLRQTDEINRVYDLCAARGAKVLLSGATIVKNSLTAASQIMGGADQKAYIDAVDKYLHVTRISDPAKYILGREYSYNSVWHVNTAGQVLRTGYLADDLIAYLRK